MEKLLSDTDKSAKELPGIPGKTEMMRLIPNPVSAWPRQQPGKGIGYGQA
jgi:hypothetical protein